jgi:transaldolase
MERAKPIEDLAVDIYADDAKPDEIIELAQLPYVKGFTTNPSLMRAAGVTDYVAYGKDIPNRVGGKPISLEVFADDLVEMERQARTIATWGENIYVKIPVSTTHGESTLPLVRTLSHEGMKLNITLIFHPSQVEAVAEALSPTTPSIVSVFAGRIADVGIDPKPVMRDARAVLAGLPAAKLLWASCREVFNIYEAEEVGAHIITVPRDILKKLPAVGSDLIELSRAGVAAFYKDSTSSGFSM